MRAKKLIRKNILDLIPYSSARDDFKSDKNFIYLDANESSYGNDLNRYPDNRHLKLIQLDPDKDNHFVLQLLFLDSHITGHIFHHQ